MKSRLTCRGMERGNLKTMPDERRLRIIDQAGSSVDQNYAAMQGLYQSGVLLSMNRARDANDVASVKALWGVE